MALSTAFVSSTSEQSASFLTLPAELRNRIYHYTFQCDIYTPWNPDSRFWHRHEAYACQCTGMPLLRVCQQIRSETIPIFYGTHTIRFDTYNRAFLEEWLQLAVSEVISSIQRIDLCGFSSSSSMVVDLRWFEPEVCCVREGKKQKHPNADEIELFRDVGFIVQDLKKGEDRFVFTKEKLGEVFDCLCSFIDENENEERPIGMR